MERIYLAGGCFWGLQKFFDQFEGVERTEVGYANGPDAAPSYQEVCASSGHAETVLVEYDEKKIGLVMTGPDTVCVIDSGNDKDAGKKVKRHLEANSWKLPYFGRICPRMGEHAPNAWGLHDFLQSVGYEVVQDTVLASPDNDCFFKSARKDYFFADAEVDPIKWKGPPRTSCVDVLLMTWPKMHTIGTHPKIIFRLVVGPDPFGR